MNSSSPIAKGLILGAVQILLVASLGAKLLYDRKTRPRVWVQAQAFDPELPIRGRYLAETLIVPAEGSFHKPDRNDTPKDALLSFFYDEARLEIRNGQLVAVPATDNRGQSVTLHQNPDGTATATLQEPVLFFIPDSTNFPVLKSGQQIWVEVTVPAHGPPRPIRLAIKQNGTLTPIR
jgi:hypothetical protein